MPMLRFRRKASSISRRGAWLLVLHDGDDFSRGAGHIGGDHQTDVAIFL
jgi:hypothetical protein